jgi:heme exporter protein D
VGPGRHSNNSLHASFASVPNYDSNRGEHQFRQSQLFDAHFAVAVTASPVSVYLAYSAVRCLFNRPNTLFQKLTYGKAFICCVGIALPFLWLAINITLSFYPRAFRNNPENCQKMTFMEWFEFQAVSNFVGVLDVMGRRDSWNDLQGRGGLGAISLTLMWIWAVYLVRHRYDILREIRLRRQQETKGFLRKNLLTIVNIVYVSW